MKIKQSRSKRRQKYIRRRITVSLALTLILLSTFFLIKNYIIKNMDNLGVLKSITAFGISNKDKTIINESKNNDNLNKIEDIEEDTSKKTPNYIDDSIIIAPNTEGNTSKSDKETNNKPNENSNIPKKDILDTSEDINYKEVFGSSLFIGDSITEGLSHYELLDEETVIAKLGFTLLKANKELSNIKTLKPENVFILLGTNEVESNMSSEKFIKNYTELINNIKDKYPEASIYVQSILPVDPKVQKKLPFVTTARIQEFNSAIIEMAKNESLNYLNVASVLENIDKDLHESDGIHFKYPFYKLWLNYLHNNI
ncbi:GDSL-type esterase/lipase family protein [Alkaliphilus sp. B6464]|uniref:GDSL-type esterase/lipase family protein n=1 Tax=Alkaliphilus sp. B6464 TaxID=2731219 RepID=UPI001BA7D057|nr:GDSL-type esterase/lipase family protein [Alkaliphilus sp. B6464]QUH19548.1 hypothetical protein HYG84_06355 [Alkaliphilus sp. B6464]